MPDRRLIAALQQIGRSGRAPDQATENQAVRAGYANRKGQKLALTPAGRQQIASGRR